MLLKSQTKKTQTVRETDKVWKIKKKTKNLQGLWKVSYHIVFKRLLIIRSRVDVKWLFNSYLPWQIIPSPVNPRLQVQFTEPSVLIQTAFSSHGFESGAHSLMSEKTYAKKKSKEKLRGAFTLQGVKSNIRVFWPLRHQQTWVGLRLRKVGATLMADASILLCKTLVSLLIPQERGCRLVSCDHNIFQTV